MSIMTVVRFDIPNTLPIFTFEDNTYFVTLSFINNDFTQVLNIQNVDINNPSSRNIYTFQQFVDSINTALQTSFTNLKTAFPAAPPTEAPFMVFNHETDIFSLYTQQLYDPIVAGANTIEIFFNYDLYSFFYNSFKVENYGVNLPSQKDYRFIISDERKRKSDQTLNHTHTQKAKIKRIKLTFLIVFVFASCGHANTSLCTNSKIETF